MSTLHRLARTKVEGLAQSSVAPPLINEADLQGQLQSFVIEHDIEHLLRDDRFGIAPKQKGQVLGGYFPALEPIPCDPNQVAKSWLAHERRRIVFLYLHIPFCVKK